MSKPELITLGGPLDGPGNQLRAAMLLAALMMTTVGPPLLLFYPRAQHAVKVDLGAEGTGARRYHPIVVTPEGDIFLDGVLRPGRVGLRIGLDRLLAADDELAVALLPRPDARYEDVAEVLAVIRRASVPHVRVTAAE